MLNLKYPEGTRYLGMLYTPERLSFLIASGYANRTSMGTPYKIAINLRDYVIISTTSKDIHSAEFMVDDQIDRLMHPKLNKKLLALKALRSL